MSKRETELQRLSRQVNFTKFRLMGAKSAIEDAWRLICGLDPEHKYPAATSEDLVRMIILLERLYEARKAEIKENE